MTDEPGRRLTSARRRPPAQPMEGAPPGRGVPTNGQAPGAEIDWRRWAHVFWRRKWWILLITALGTAAAWYHARGERLTYQARAMVWFESPDRGSSPVQMPMPIEILNVFSAPGWADLLRSYAVLDGVVHELNLYVSPLEDRDRPLFQDFELAADGATRYGRYRLMVRMDSTRTLLDSRGDEVETVEAGDPIGASLGFRWVPPADRLVAGREVEFSVRRPRSAADALDNRLQVTTDERGGNFIRLTYTDTDADHAALVLNTLLDHFVSMARELKRQKLTNMAGTLEEQLSQASERLRQAEAELQEYRVSTITLPEERRDRIAMTPPPVQDAESPYSAPSGTSVLQDENPVFDRYFTLQVERDRLRNDREDLQRILRNYEETGQMDVMLLETIPTVRTASSLAAALEELGRLELEHRSLLYRYTEEHAEVQRLARSIRELRHESIPALVRQLIDRLGSRETQLAREIDAQTDDLEGIPPRAMEEARLRREFMNAEQLYNMLHSQYKQAQVAEAATQPEVRVLDRAVPPPSPTGTTERLKIAVGLVLSFGMAVLGVIVHEQFFNRRLQYPEQVVADLGLPILGVVPNLKRLPSRASAAESAGTPHVLGAIESFRALRTQLTHGVGIEYPAVIAITSPSMGDGKSLVVTNLALAFAEPDRPTVLVDADMRRGSLHRIFGFARSPGLSEYLRGEAQVDEIVRATQTAGLHLIPRGHWSEEVPERLDDEVLPTLLGQLKESADVILIDTPPLSAGVDAVLIGAHVDAVLAVLRTGRTDLELARTKIASYAQMLGVPIVGAVLNDVQADSAYGPYRYYTYSYPYEPT